MQYTTHEVLHVLMHMAAVLFASHMVHAHSCVWSFKIIYLVGVVKAA